MNSSREQPRVTSTKNLLYIFAPENILLNYAATLFLDIKQHVLFRDNSNLDIYDVNLNNASFETKKFFRQNKENE